eukprot:UN00569
MRVVTRWKTPKVGHIGALFCDRVFGIKKEINWLESALVCYIRAASLDFEKFGCFISRILWIPTYDDNSNKLTDTFEKIVEKSIPVWNWIPWIP